jgi:hypothetical protein
MLNAPSAGSRFFLKTTILMFPVWVCRVVLVAFAGDAFQRCLENV